MCNSVERLSVLYYTGINTTVRNFTKGRKSERRQKRRYRRNVCQFCVLLNAVSQVFFYFCRILRVT